jgi:hypothetical protein
LHTEAVHASGEGAEITNADFVYPRMSGESKGPVFKGTVYENMVSVQVRELAVSAEHLYKEKIRIEAEKEMEEENIVNRLQRQIEHLIQNYKVPLLPLHLSPIECALSTA